MTEVDADNGELLAAIDKAGAWLELPGVHLIGAGERAGQPCIVVHVSPPLARLRGLVPDEFLGFPVQLVASGEVTARGQ